MRAKRDFSRIWTFLMHFLMRKGGTLIIFSLFEIPWRGEFLLAKPHGGERSPDSSMTRRPCFPALADSGFSSYVQARNFHSSGLQGSLFYGFKLSYNQRIILYIGCLNSDQYSFHSSRSVANNQLFDPLPAILPRKCRYGFSFV